MDTPTGYLERFYPSLVANAADYCVRVLRALYGLKQSGYLWHEALTKKLLEIGFVSTLDACTFYLREANGSICLIAFHVDDVLAVMSPSMQDRVVTALTSLFRCSSPVIYPTEFLHWNVEYQHDADGVQSIKLSARSFIERLESSLTRTDADFVSYDVKLPLAPQLSQGTGTLLDPAGVKKYQRLVGSLNYASTSVRADISFSASLLGSFAAAPTEVHLQSALRVCRYLFSNKDLGLTYVRREPLVAPHGAVCHLLGYSDSDWAGNVDTRKSQSGVVVEVIGGGVVDYHSRAQSMVAMSTEEAELNALISACNSVRYFRDLLSMIFPDAFGEQQATTIRVDNTAAVAVTSSLTPARNRHVAMRVSLLRDLISKSVVCVEHVPTKYQAADILTKTFRSHQQLCDALEMLHMK